MSSRGRRPGVYGRRPPPGSTGSFDDPQASRAEANR
jgi:hypothetical protein